MSQNKLSPAETALLSEYPKSSIALSVSPVLVSLSMNVPLIVQKLKARKSRWRSDIFVSVEAS